ncbi:MAG: hypothetical protein IKV77_09925, partial [Alistipes sp.]|nr:hypothetical protein [Alistipes sp.]
YRIILFHTPWFLGENSCRRGAFENIFFPTIIPTCHQNFTGRNMQKISKTRFRKKKKLQFCISFSKNQNNNTNMLLL